MLIKRKNNPPNPLARFLRDRNQRFIVPVISIKTTGIPKDFGKIPKQDLRFATVGAASSRDYRGWKPLPQTV